MNTESRDRSPKAGAVLRIALSGTPKPGFPGRNRDLARKKPAIKQNLESGKKNVLRLAGREAAKYNPPRHSAFLSEQLSRSLGRGDSMKETSDAPGALTTTQTEQPKGKEYRTPELQDYGDIHDLTLSGGKNKFDGSGHS
jgi:hypothetical protein